MDLDTRPPSRCPPNLHINARRGVQPSALPIGYSCLTQPSDRILANTLRLAHLRWPTLTHSDIELAALLARAWLHQRTHLGAGLRETGGRQAAEAQPNAVEALCLSVAR